jgi:hypothetical protein
MDTVYVGIFYNNDFINKEGTVEKIIALKYISHCILNSYQIINRTFN